jgi:hypothetical protein
MKIVFTSAGVAAVLLALWATAAAAGAPVELPVGQTLQVEAVTIGFDKVSGEGRCPIGVLCFWEGNAACEMWLQLPGKGRIDFTLNTSSTFRQEFEHDGTSVRLLILEPYPVYEQPIDPSTYVATLIVETGAPTRAEPSTWSRIKSLYAR